MANITVLEDGTLPAYAWPYSESGSEVKMMGISDEVLHCECCGKQNLRRTIVIEFDGAIAHYGCDCAARALKGRGIKVTGKAVEKQAELVARRKSQVAFQADMLARIDGMLAAGHSRYLVVGQPVGAELAELRESTVNSLGFAQEALNAAINQVAA